MQAKAWLFHKPHLAAHYQYLADIHDSTRVIYVDIDSSQWPRALYFYSYVLSQSSTVLPPWSNCGFIQALVASSMKEILTMPGSECFIRLDLPPQGAPSCKLRLREHTCLCTMCHQCSCSKASAHLTAVVCPGNPTQHAQLQEKTDMSIIPETIFQSMPEVTSSSPKNQTSALLILLAQLRANSYVCVLQERTSVCVGSCRPYTPLQQESTCSSGVVSSSLQSQTSIDIA